VTKIHGDCPSCSCVPVLPAESGPAEGAAIAVPVQGAWFKAIVTSPALGGEGAGQYFCFNVCGSTLNGCASMASEGTDWKRPESLTAEAGA
jgi:hypothetical protein